MKNTFKILLLALAVSLFVAGCNGNTSSSAADSTKIDSSTTVKSHTDTTVIADTAKQPTDPSKMKKDTVSKTTASTEVKKTEIKKHK